MAPTAQRRAQFLVAMFGACVGVCDAQARLDVQLLSGRPDMVTGGSVLIEVSVPPATAWTAELNHRDVTKYFKPTERSDEVVALLSGLTIGDNDFRARAVGNVGVSLHLINHPLSGPVFSGVHQQPFICQDAENGLGRPLDSDCSARSIVLYYYKSTLRSAPDYAVPDMPEGQPGKLSPGFKSYPLDGPRPTDVAKTVTSTGTTVDYIVRREIGVINRGVYEIQLLGKPGDVLPSPWSRRTTEGKWNGRLVYEFQVGCSPGYHQGMLRDPIGGPQERLLSQGYAIATSTLNVFDNGCNDRISAETAMMVKEYFIKRFGVPVHTIGWGASGGAMQVYLTAQNYPGLLDGIVALASYPDAPTFLEWASDVALLQHAFAVSKLVWHDWEKAAVTGSGAAAFRRYIVNAQTQQAIGHAVEPPMHVYQGECDESVPKRLQYDADSNRSGARCDIYTNEGNVFGRNKTGAGLRPLDNVGVQYGLDAFNAGKIDAEHFVTLNESVGGMDADGNIVPDRTEADVQSLRNAYERGLVLSGGGGLSEIPIIDWHAYSDDLGGSIDGHFRVLSFITRARLIASNGHADNQVIMVDPREAWFDLRKSNFWGPVGGLVKQMDLWLNGIAADHAGGSVAKLISRNRPDALMDGCTALDGEIISERPTIDTHSRCNELYPIHENPRIAAGEPLANNVLKCALKAIAKDDYVQSITPTQFERLQLIFPSGVCDYSHPGIGQRGLENTWLRF